MEYLHEESLVRDYFSRNFHSPISMECLLLSNVSLQYCNTNSKYHSLLLNQKKEVKELKIRKRLKRIIKKLRRFKGILWFTTIISFFSLVVYGYLMNLPNCIRVANLIALFYFMYSVIVATNRYERTWAVVCVLLFLFFIFW